LSGTDTNFFGRGLEAGKAHFNVVDSGLEILEDKAPPSVAQDFLDENVTKKQTRQNGSRRELSLRRADLNLQ
jgi:hypothetical protein